MQEEGGIVSCKATCLRYVIARSARLALRPLGNRHTPLRGQCSAIVLKAKAKAKVFTKATLIVQKRKRTRKSLRVCFSACSAPPLTKLVIASSFGHSPCGLVPNSDAITYTWHSVKTMLSLNCDKWSIFFASVPKQKLNTVHAPLLCCQIDLYQFSDNHFFTLASQQGTETKGVTQSKSSEEWK